MARQSEWDWVEACAKWGSGLNDDDLGRIVSAGLTNAELHWCEKPNFCFDADFDALLQHGKARGRPSLKRLPGQVIEMKIANVIKKKKEMRRKDCKIHGWVSQKDGRYDQSSLDEVSAIWKDEKKKMYKYRNIRKWKQTKSSSECQRAELASLTKYKLKLGRQISQH